MTTQGAQRVAGIAVLLSCASRTPPSLDPRLGSARAANTEMPLKCVTGTGRAARLTRVKLALRQRGLGQECRAVSLFVTQAWKALKWRRLGSAVGGALPCLLRSSHGPPQPPPGEGYAFSRPPTLPASLPAAAAEISSRGNYADPSRGSSPRPSSPPPPLCWGSRAGLLLGEGSDSQEAAGGSELQATEAPSHVTPPSFLRSPPALWAPAGAPTAQRTMRLPGRTRPQPAPQPAQHPALRRQVEPPGQLLRLFYCTVLVCSKEIAALTDFSGKSALLRRASRAPGCAQVSPPLGAAARGATIWLG